MTPMQRALSRWVPSVWWTDILALYRRPGVVSGPSWVRYEAWYVSLLGPYR